MSLALAVALLIAVGLSACGSSSDTPTPAAGAPSNLITQAEADKYPADSVEHAFLEFWSDLQYQSWAEVASFYDPALRSVVGTASIIGAKKINASTYQQLKPTIVRVRSSDGLTTINYTLQFIDGSKELTSISWRKQGGSWLIDYDSRLDNELRQYAENRVEIEQNGALPAEAEELSPEATRAGEAAAQAQARFLQQEFDLKSP